MQSPEYPLEGIRSMPHVEISVFSSAGKTVLKLTDGGTTYLEVHLEPAEAIQVFKRAIEISQQTTDRPSEKKSISRVMRGIFKP